MIETELHEKLNPEAVFELYSIADEELVRNAQDVGWNQASIEDLRASREQGRRSYLYLYYALYRGKQNGLSGKDLLSFAELITRLITGIHISFGIDTPAKEYVIEDNLKESYALLIMRKAETGDLKPIRIAQYIVDSCISQYWKTRKLQLIPKNYTLREDQINAIANHARNKGLDNVSMGLRDLIDTALVCLAEKERK